ncbi:MAG: thioesterase family protein [Cytophagales bacterium]|nr:acyl-CoA thioesterase [Bernardetiaceae bacterium]MDW8203427.1 thioesterase family protein [Cytophagales bacterium]
MFTSTTEIRVRYAHTDQMGYVYYGNYASFFEIARVESLRSIGLSYKALEANGIMMPVYENYSRYLAPAGFDELLTVKVLIKELPSVKITFHYEIFNEANQLIHTGYTVLVFINRESRRPCRAPKQLLEALKPYFEQVA